MTRRRSSGFSVKPEDLPDVSRPGWGGVRDAFREIRRLQSDAVERYGKIREDADLKPEARVRKLDAIIAETTTAVAKVVGQARGTVSEVQGKIGDLVKAAVDPDPLAPPRVNFGTIVLPGERALASLQLESIRRTSGVERRLARAEVDLRIDRALDADKEKVGLPLLQLYRAVLKEGDPVGVHVFEAHAPGRIRAEGSNSQQELLRLEVEAARAARMPEEVKLALDHSDALGEAFMFVETTQADATAAGFYEEGRSAALTSAVQFLGEELAGLGSSAVSP